MRRPTYRWCSALTLVFVVWTGGLFADDLTFENRVKAQEAIERVYYSHQIGATRPFESAVPVAVLKKKVLTYLRQTVALEMFWRTPVTPEMLHAELERMARQSRMPERLRQLYAALGNDSLLVQECLARPALVDRLSRNFFAYDSIIHTEARTRAGLLRREAHDRGAEPSGRASGSAGR